MTNEKLAERIKGGERDKLPELWEQVEGLVKWQARKVIAASNNPHFEFDDLYNSGYIAMVKAIDGYTAEKGAFNTWFMFYLKTAFAEVTGYRTKRQRFDPIHNADSLDKPLKDDTDSTLHDIVSDPNNDINEAEQSIYNEQLHTALEKAIKHSLNSQQKEVIRLKYYKGLNYNQVGDILGISRVAVREHDLRALQRLRIGKSRHILEQFIDIRTNYYLTGSVKQQSSPVETLVVQREKWRSELSGKKITEAY